MTVALIGGGLSTPVDRTLFRYRITWRFSTASFLPNSGFNTYEVAEQLRDALPANGMIAYSPIEAVDGDPFIQFTVQLAQAFPGYTLADVVKYANKLPLFSFSTFMSLQLALDVSEVEVRAAALSATIIRAQNEVSRQRAIDAADAAEVTTKIGNAAGAAGGAVADAATQAAKTLGEKIDEYFKSLFGGLKDVAKFTVGVAGLIGVAYVIVRYRK